MRLELQNLVHIICTAFTTGIHGRILSFKYLFFPFCTRSRMRMMSQERLVLENTTACFVLVESFPMHPAGYNYISNRRTCFTPYCRMLYCVLLLLLLHDFFRETKTTGLSVCRSCRSYAFGVGVLCLWHSVALLHSFPISSRTSKAL